MKICFISPYIPKHFGGGEKYLLDCARIAATKHDVYVAISEDKNSHLDFDQVKQQYEAFLGLSLADVQFILTPLRTSASSWYKLLWTKQFDCIYYLTDGSLFFSLAPNNVLHIQVPLQLNKAGIFERIKLLNWQIKNTNSEFTKKVIERTWQTKVNVVHQPMVDIPQVDTVKRWIKHKDKTILHVGRFFTQLHSKRQDVIVETFKKMIDQYPIETQGWKLILIGSVEDQNFARKVKNQTQNYPIEIYHQVDRFELIKHYQQASIYWHATGFGLDQYQYPEKMEHFGISTAEAMAHGCLPIVINKGGQVEILGETLGGFLWDTEAECIEKTISQIANQDSLHQNQLLAYERSKYFGEQVFKDKLFSMIGE